MWYKHYNWNSNPFSVKHNTNLVGFEKQKQKAIDYLVSGDIFVITGEAGAGKTSLLKWLQKNLKSHRVLYLSAENTNEFFSLEKYTRSIFGRKNTVLLLDEAHLSDENLITELKNIWDNKKIKSAVIAQPKIDLANYSQSMRSRIGNRIITLKKMDTETAKELIDLRTQGNHPFTTEMIEEITKASKRNPRTILENCEAVCMTLRGKTPTMKDVKDLLEEKRREGLMHLELLDEPTLPDNLAPVDKANLKGFSPMQQKMIKVLYEGNRTAKQLASILGTTEGSVGKQLSNLIEQNVASVENNRRPKMYGLQGSFKSKIL